MELLRLLAQRHELHFLGFSYLESESELSVAFDELGQVCQSVNSVQLRVTKSSVWRAKFKFLTRFVPVDAVLFESDEMSRSLRDSIARVRPDVVLIQFPQMAQYVSVCTDVATVMDVQDAFSVSGFRKFRSQTTPLKKIAMLANWVSWLFYESRYYPIFDVVAAITEQDRIGLEIYTPGIGADVIKAAVSIPETSSVPREPGTIGFIGSFAHYPNVEGLRYFIKQVLPQVLAQRPNTRLRVAGGNPPQELLELAGVNVEFLGFVPDANVFMQSQAIVVVPLLSGGGIKIKTLHAMACACPLVTTSIGAEEIGLVNGEHAIVGDTSAQFADGVLALLNQPTSAAQLGEKARALVAQSFSQDAKAITAEKLLNVAHEKSLRRKASEKIRPE